MLSGFVAGAKRGGVRIYEGTEATGILLEKGKIEGVRTKLGDIAAPIVVNAGGPFASLIGEMAGVEIPVKPLRRQVFVSSPFHLTDQIVPLTIDFHRGWYFRQETDGFLLSVRLDQAPSLNLNIDYEAMVEAAENATYRVPGLEKARIARGWAGLYEISPDHHAILERFLTLRD